MFNAKSIHEFVESHRDEAISALQEIVRCPSVTGDEEAVSFIFERYLKENGFAVNRVEAAPHRPCLLTEMAGTRPGKRFVFQGHMDVFPPDPSDPGQYGPWAGEIVDGRLYGRGSVDMKAGTVGAMMTLIFLKKMGYDPQGSIQLAMMCDEENGGRLGVQNLIKQGLIQGDFGITPEPSDQFILRRYAGILRGYVTYRAPAQHNGTPYKFGLNAIQKAVRAIMKLEAIIDRLKLECANAEPTPVMTLSVINGGTAPNCAPSDATFWFDRRLSCDENHETALAEITAILDDLKAKDPTFEYELTVTSARPPLDIPADDPFIRLLQDAYESIHGRRPEAITGIGASDGTYVRNATGMPIPDFGVDGRISQIGKPNENVGLQDYLDFIKVYMLSVVNALG